jgi:nicotinamidase-related amidase
MDIKRSGSLGPTSILLATAVVLAGCGEDAASAEATPSEAAATAQATAEAAEAADEVVVLTNDGPALEASQVGGLPVYPGLVVASRSDGMTTDGITTLPAVVAFAHDKEMDEVVAFFAEKLEGWQQRDQWGNQVFFQGEPDEDFDLMEPESMTRPSIAVMPPVGQDRPVRVQYIHERP